MTAMSTAGEEAPPFTVVRLDVPQWTVTASFGGQTWTWTHAGPVTAIERVADGALELLPANSGRWELRLSEGENTFDRILGQSREESPS